MRITATRLFLLVGSVLVVTFGAEAHRNFGISVEPVVYLAPGFPVVPGSLSIVHRSLDGASMWIKSTGFTPNTVVSAWWINFNNPENCTHPDVSHGWLCTGPDLADPATGGSYQFADSQIVKDRGRIVLRARLPVGETSGCASPSLPCIGLTNPIGAEYHIALRTMGPVIPALLEEQRTTLDAGCGPGEPNAGLCANVQGAVHPPRQ